MDVLGHSVASVETVVLQLEHFWGHRGTILGPSSYHIMSYVGTILGHIGAIVLAYVEPYVLPAHAH